MIGDEISEGSKAVQESAKAVQEIAKTANTGLKLTGDFGGWFSDLTKSPLKSLSGIFTDHLDYLRWERRERLKIRSNEFIAAKELSQKEAVPPKLALPIIEKASLEENDELQDLWAQLIASAVDPAFKGKIRSAFIDMIGQLEVIDARLLLIVYQNYKEARKGKEWGDRSRMEFTHHEEKIDWQLLSQSLKIDYRSFQNSVDNLIRLQCIRLHSSKNEVEIPKPVYPTTGQIYPSVGPSFKYEKVVTQGVESYESIELTSLGYEFAEACIPQRS